MKHKIINWALFSTGKIKNILINFEQELYQQQRENIINQHCKKSSSNVYVEEDGQISQKQIFHNQRAKQKGVCAWDGKPLQQVSEIYRFENYPNLFLLCRNQENRQKLQDINSRNQAFMARQAALMILKAHNFETYHEKVQQQIRSFYQLQGENAINNLEKFYQDFQNYSPRKLGSKSKSKYNFIIKQAHTQKKKCVWCNTLLDFDNNQTNSKRATIEHLIPRSKGGPNHKANLALACSACNHKRGDITISQWIKKCKSQGKYPQSTCIRKKLQQLPSKYVDLSKQQLS